MTEHFSWLNDQQGHVIYSLLNHLIHFPTNDIDDINKIMSKYLGLELATFFSQNELRLLAAQSGHFNFPLRRISGRVVTNFFKLHAEN